MKRLVGTAWTSGLFGCGGGGDRDGLLLESLNLEGADTQTQIPKIDAADDRSQLDPQKFFGRSLGLFRGLLIFNPEPNEVPRFCRFIEEILPRHKVNHLILNLRYRFEFSSHPEIVDDRAISPMNLWQIATACKNAGIELVPKLNLLAHQSEERVLPILRAYPNFDESPGRPVIYPNPNPLASGFYSKCLCTQSSGVKSLLGDLLYELIDLLDPRSFHVGLDEVWDIGSPWCPRCRQQDPALLFANYVNWLEGFLRSAGVGMLMWGDRLIDGQSIGINPYSSSWNGTHRALVAISRSIVICDWHYGYVAPTLSLFSRHRFRVVASLLDNESISRGFLSEMALQRSLERQLFSKERGLASIPRQKKQLVPTHYQIGYLQTTWMKAGDFMDAYYNGFGAESNVRVAEHFKKLLHLESLVGLM